MRAEQKVGEEGPPAVSDDQFCSRPSPLLELFAHADFLGADALHLPQADAARNGVVGGNCQAKNGDRAERRVVVSPHG